MELSSAVWSELPWAEKSAQGLVQATEPEMASEMAQAKEVTTAQASEALWAPAWEALSAKVLGAVRARCLAAASAHAKAME